MVKGNSLRWFHAAVPVRRHDNTSELTSPWRVWVCIDAMLMVEQRMRSKTSAENLPTEGEDNACGTLVA